MRAALALILFISLATAFKLEKERPVVDDDLEKQDEANERDEGNNEVITRFKIGSWDIKFVWCALTNKNKLAVFSNQSGASPQPVATCFSALSICYMFFRFLRQVYSHPS